MTPQHLQLADAYHEGLLAARLAALQPASWGVLSLALDTQALSRGVIQLLSFSGVMPDGVHLDLPAGSPELPPVRPIGELFTPTTASLTVHLALPIERAGVDNYAEGLTNPTRYRIVPQRIYDLAGGEEPEEIPTARYAPFFIVGNERHEDVVSLPLFELVRDDKGGLVLAEAYIAPCLRIDASPYLISSLRRLLQCMMVRRRTLMEGRRQRRANEVEYHAEEVTSFLLLSAINGHVPLVKHLLSAGDLHPRALYLALIQLAGQLASFTLDVDPSALPEFNFLDLRSSFEGLFEELIGVLSAEVKERFVTISLEVDERGYYRGDWMEDGRFLSCKQFLLAVKSDLATDRVEEAFPRLAKLGSEEGVTKAVDDATDAAIVKVTRHPPPEIPVKVGTSYFAIDIDDKFWSDALHKRQVTLWLPRFFNHEETTVELFGIQAVSPSASASN